MELIFVLEGAPLSSIHYALEEPGGEHEHERMRTIKKQTYSSRGERESANGIAEIEIGILGLCQVVREDLEDLKMNSD